MHNRPACCVKSCRCQLKSEILPFHEEKKLGARIRRNCSQKLSELMNLNNVPREIKSEVELCFGRKADSLLRSCVFLNAQKAKF